MTSVSIFILCSSPSGIPLLFCLTSSPKKPLELLWAAGSRGWARTHTEVGSAGQGCRRLDLGGILGLSPAHPVR